MGSNTLILLVISAMATVLILSVHADVAKKEQPQKVEVVGYYGGGGGRGGGGGGGGRRGGGGGGGCYGCSHPGEKIQTTQQQQHSKDEINAQLYGCQYGCCHWYNYECQRCCSNANEAKLKAP